MIRINLLPHRAAKQQREILKHVIAAVAVLSLAVLLSTGLHLFSSGMLSDLQLEQESLIAENQRLRKVIGKIEHLQKLRKDVESKLDVVEKLQAGRFRSLNSLVSISQGIPENVWLTDIEDRDGSFKLSGIGESNRAVARFMRLLDRADVFDDVKLEETERKDIDGVTIQEFNMNLKRIDPPKKEPDEGSKGGGA